MKNLNAWLIILVGIVLLLPLIGVTELGTVTEGILRGLTAAPYTRLYSRRHTLYSFTRMGIPLTALFSIACASPSFFLRFWVSVSFYRVERRFF